MKQLVLITAILYTFLVCCKITKPSKEVNKVDADSLVANIDKYRNTMVETEGVIIHICGVDGKKMKFKTESGAIIKIEPDDLHGSFDTSFYKKKVKVQGLVKEARFEKTYIDKMEIEKTLLCHIDYSPCKDSVWINYQVNTGYSDTISKRGIEKLRKKMEQTKKNYISVITIIANKVEIMQAIK